MRSLTSEQRAELDALANNNPDGLTATRVWKAAKRKTSKLHDLFDWDVESAAVAHWEHTARQVILRFEVEVKVPKRGPLRPVGVEVSSVPALVSRGDGYRRSQDVMMDNDEARALLVVEVSRLGALLNRLNGLCSLNKKFSALGDYCSDARSSLDDVASELGVASRDMAGTG